MELLRLPDAAHELGVSYPTLKQWIYHKKIRSVKTPGGHHRIPRPELDRLMFQGQPRSGPALARQGTAGAASGGLEHIISGRNQLIGRITSLKIEGLLAKVSLDVGGQKITSIITRDACRDLGLKVDI